MIRTARGQYFAAQHLDVLVHEDVVDLAVRPMRGIRAAEHRSPPTREQPHDRRAPEVEVAGNHRGPTVGGQLRADVAHVRDRPRVPELRRRVQADDVDGASPTDTVHAIALRTSAWSRNTSPIGSSRQSRTGAACRPRAPNLRRAGRRRGATFATPAGEVRRAHRPALGFERIEHARSVGEAERLRYHDDVGVEPAYDRGDVETARAIDTSPADAPVGVERGDSERGRLRCRCAGRAARGGRSRRRGGSPSASPA